MRSALFIDVHAPPRHVFDLVSDIGRWPEILPHYRSVTVQSRSGRSVVASMVAVRRFGPIGVPVAWRAEQWPDDSRPDDLRLHFHHVRGVTSGMEVMWRMRPHGAGSRVSIEHTLKMRLPVVGAGVLPRIVNRFFIRPIATQTLTTFKGLAEAGA